MVLGCICPWLLHGRCRGGLSGLGSFGHFFFFVLVGWHSIVSCRVLELTVISCHRFLFDLGRLTSCLHVASEVHIALDGSTGDDKVRIALSIDGADVVIELLGAARRRTRSQLRSTCAIRCLLR